MVLILDSDSKIGAHVRSNLCYLICLKVFDKIKSIRKFDFFYLYIYLYKLNRTLKIPLFPLAQSDNFGYELLFLKQT